MIAVRLARLRGALWRWNRGGIWALELDGTIPTVADPTGYRFRPIQPHEAPGLAQVMCAAPEQVARRLAEGQRCFAAFADGAIVSYG